jgi:hypothetical protein
MPPRLTGASGRARRVGVEIEFGGLDFQQAADIVVRLYGGTIREVSRVGVAVENTSLGEFRIELDAMLLKSEKYRDVLEKLGVGEKGQERVGDTLQALLEKFVPSEIAAPPIAITDLPKLDILRETLREEGALGTRSSLLYAFGLQLNPEVPATDAATLKSFLAAFLQLYDWIVDTAKIDITRKIAPFIDPFPAEYRELVLDPKYRPDLDRLIDDYLLLNPTRNRPLDMLPLFATLREEKVLAAAKEPDQIKKRPTFHYRLPNCLIDEPDWSFADEWNRWVEVERLAERLVS